MALELSSLRKAVDLLGSAIKVSSEQAKDKIGAEHENVLRAGVIQNFEFTYELCWKFMKRWLEENVSGPAVDGVTRKELFRIAAEHHLIESVELWIDYHNARNETAHTYDAKTAETVYSSAVKFVSDAKKLLATLEAKND